MKTKVVFFTGGVFSSVGKGLTLANVGRIFKELGFRISALKLDPYLNIDSGSLSPKQHGEVYVTSDGHETDLDLGHYERFMDYEISKLSCITAGKIYQRLLNKKKAGEFSGETIQVVPHVIDEIHKAIYDLLEKESKSDFLFIEIGGTVGDIEHQPFIEAACTFKHKYGKENVLFIHIAPIFYIGLVSEFKTKPAQHSIRKLSSHNVFPDILILRSSKEISIEIKQKLSKLTLIDEKDIFVCLDNKSIYLIAEALYGEGIHRKILEKFNIPYPEDKNIDAWKKTTSNILTPKEKTIRIAIIGKYSTATDAYMSIVESFKLTSYALDVGLEIDHLNVEKVTNLADLDKYSAICVPYGFGSRGSEEKIRVIEYCRIKQIPFLGICLGMQMACIEYFRNVLGYKNAHTIEINPDTDTPLFIPLHNEKMRLGKQKVKIIDSTITKELLNKEYIYSRHRHRYYFNNKYKEILKDSDLVISGVSADSKEIVEIVELKNHPFFLATQFHPEFETKFSNISPIFIEFIKAGIKKG